MDATKTSIWKMVEYWMAVNQPWIAQIGNVPENLPEDDRLALLF